MDVRSDRRKFLRGSLAAPVVLTVSSPSVQAATSFGRCLAKLEGQQALFFAASADNWFRALVKVDQLWSQGQDRGYFFLDQVKNVYVGVVPPYSALTFGQVLDPGWKITGSSTRSALVWFSTATMAQYAKITVQQPRGYLAATISCYSSFARG